MKTPTGHKGDITALFSLKNESVKFLLHMSVDVKLIVVCREHKNAKLIILTGLKFWFCEVIMYMWKKENEEEEFLFDD